MSKYNKTKIIKNSVYVILLVGLIGYAIFNSRILIAGPQIDIMKPKNGSTITENPLIRVSGTAENISFLELNGKRINVNEERKFNEPVLLYPGYNIVTMVATDKFNRVIENKIEVVYKENINNSIEDTVDEKFDEDNNLEIETSTLEISTSSPTSSLEEI